jgi:hypothetical protein
LPGSDAWAIQQKCISGRKQQQKKAYIMIWLDSL